MEIGDIELILLYFLALMGLTEFVTWIILVVRILCADDWEE